MCCVLTARDCREHMGNSVEEEELRGRRGLDEHDDAASDDRQQSNHVDDPNTVQDDVAWTGQRFARQGHLRALLRSLLLGDV